MPTNLIKANNIKQAVEELDKDKSIGSIAGDVAIELNKKVIISDEAKRLGLKTTYAIIRGVNVKNSDEELDILKKRIGSEFDEKRLKYMQDSYRSFGIDPQKRVPSAEALIKRLKEGKPLYKINTLVDAYNLSSIRESLPMAAYDLSKVDFPITLRMAKDGEEITLIGGEKKKIKSNEIVYADSSDILCLDFNYRDCDKTKITDKTKDIIVFVDGCNSINGN